MKNNCKKGKLGEELAENILKDKGYEVVCKNYITKYGEIDIIARKEERLVFVEVKTRTNRSFGEPSESVGKDKRKRIRQTAESFILDYDGQWLEAEFQVMEILINHLENLDFSEV